MQMTSLFRAPENNADKAAAGTMFEIKTKIIGSGELGYLDQELQAELFERRTKDGNWRRTSGMHPLS